MSEEQRARILACKDVVTLDRWLRQAVTVKSVAKLFSRGAGPKAT